MDPKQTNERILRYAKENGLSKICLTDHYWDSAVLGASNWYEPQNFEHISQAKPLPQDKEVEFFFGCETDMDKFFTVGIPPEKFDAFDFIIIPTTHLHMKGFAIYDNDFQNNKRVAQLWIERLGALLDKDMPFNKIGIAHLVCYLINNKSRKDYLETLSLISEKEMQSLFAKAAKVGVGIELNQSDMSFDDGEADIVLRPFRIAKSCGCKFYLGSDAHAPSDFTKTKETFERAIELLALDEQDKFHIHSNKRDN